MRNDRVRPRRWWQYLVALSIFAFPIACHAAGTGGSGGTGGGPVNAPPGSPFRSARVDVVDHPARMEGGRWYRGGKTATLVLDDGRAPQSHPLAPADGLPPAQLRFASDGHALVVSLSGGRDWILVALDAGPAPLICRHLLLVGADPWPAAPKTRDLALEILASPKAARNHAVVDPRPPHSFASLEPELRVALDYAFAHGTDPALRRAVLDAWLGRGDTFSPPLVASAMPRLVQLVRDHVDLQDRLVAPSGGALSLRGFELLGAWGTPRAQSRMAQIVKELGAPPRDRAADEQWLTAIHALARSVVAQRKTTDDVVAALVEVANHNRPLPTTLQYPPEKRQAIERRFCASRLAVLALASADRPAAKTALMRLAEGPCKESAAYSGADVVVTDRPPRPTWPTELLPLADEMGRDAAAHFTPACWARLGLAPPAPIRVR